MRKTFPPNNFTEWLAKEREIEGNRGKEREEKKEREREEGRENSVDRINTAAGYLSHIYIYRISSLLVRP